MTMFEIYSPKPAPEIRKSHIYAAEMPIPREGAQGLCTPGGTCTSGDV